MLKKIKIPAVLKNKFVLTPIVFVVWMFFFNDVDLFFIMRSKQELNAMQKEVKYLKEQNELTREQLHDLTTNKETLEKFARETYFMKKPNEDLFIVKTD